jgi:phage-related minor tail protein
MGYDIGATVGITGEAEFKNSLKAIREEFKVLGSEMKLAASQFDKNDASAAALTARNQVLGKEIELQRGRVNLLTSQYDKQVTALSKP